MLQGIAEEVNKQADQRISSRFITYVPDVHDLALNTQRVGAMKVQQNRKKKLKRNQDYYDFEKKHNCGTIVERYLNWTSSCSSC